MEGVTILALLTNIYAGPNGGGEITGWLGVKEVGGITTLMRLVNGMKSEFD